MWEFHIFRFFPCNFEEAWNRLLKKKTLRASFPTPAWTVETAAWSAESKASASLRCEKIM